MTNFYKMYNEPEKLKRYNECGKQLNAFTGSVITAISMSKEYDNYTSILHIIKQNGINSLRYAEYIKQGTFPDGEPCLLQDRFVCLYYAKNIKKGRWKEAEDLFITDPWWSFMYAKDIIKGRWLEAEGYIYRSEKYCRAYRELVLGIK